MPRLELYDTVVAKSDHTLIGSVERTYNESEGLESLEESLILLNLPVSQDVLTDFVTSGIPPKGFVFVKSLEEERGSFLASEDDLILQSRSFDLGDVVKRHDGMTGTVVDVFDAYSIQPIWLTDGTPASTLSMSHIRHCDPNSPDGCPHNVISHVPGLELNHQQALFEEDLVCYKEWLGVVSELELDVIVQIGDSIVVLRAPEDLYLPIPEPNVPLVSLPDLLRDVLRPDIVSAFQGHSWVLPIVYPRVGSYVITSHSNLKNGRWIVGKYSATMEPGGTVLDLLPHTAFCHWLSCNPFAALKIGQIKQPLTPHTLYDNSGTYKSGTALKLNPDMRVIDLLSPPRSEVSRPVEADNSTSTSSHDIKPTSLHQDFKVGDSVKFRDPTAAALKYQDDDNASSGKFHRISTELTHGWDLNVFRIIAKGQSVQVLWQDGSIDIQDSNELQRFGGFESDFSPTDVVVNRAGMKMIRVGAHALEDFNEMTIFEAPHSLHPTKVGVIQSVDARERVAKIRWFEAPSIVLVDNGNRISAESKLGPISDVIHEVSLYEVMTFPALERHLRDVALLTPRSPSKRAMEIIYSSEEAEADVQQSALAGLWGPQRIVFAVRDIIRERGFLKPDGTKSAKEKGSKHHFKTHGVDWLGEIIKLGLDGSLTVRLSGATPVRDLNVSSDEILGVVNIDYVLGQSNIDDELWDEDEDDDSWLVDETFEYEGGDRLDDDADDENWISAEEDVDEDDNEGEATNSHPPPDGDIEMTDAPDLTTQRKAPPRPDVEASEMASFDILNSHLPALTPPPFEILSITPPPDQYQPPESSSPPSSSSFLKRIRHEHKVLSTSLPTGQIYVRTYDSRLDLLRCLIIGPTDTPYEHAPFLVDLYLPPTFPNVPPIAHFHSWTSGLGRINPNLYEEGKICLSLLGTWPGKNSKEGWSKDATILQVLVSLQGLVMVPKPFFNEAGFENEEAGGGYTNESATYSERAFVMARGFVGFALTKPPIGLEDVLAWLYLPIPPDSTNNSQKQSDQNEQNTDLLEKVITRSNALITASDRIRSRVAQQSTTDSNSNLTAMDATQLDGAGEPGDPTKSFLRPLSKGAIVMLNRRLEELGSCLERWKDRRSLEDVGSGGGNGSEQ